MSWVVKWTDANGFEHTNAYPNKKVATMVVKKLKTKVVGSKVLSIEKEDTSA